MELELVAIQDTEKLGKDGNPEEVLQYTFRGKGTATEMTLTIKGDGGALAAAMGNLNAKAAGDVISVELKPNSQTKISP